MRPLYTPHTQSWKDFGGLSTLADMPSYRGHWVDLADMPPWRAQIPIALASMVWLLPESPCSDF